jgi:ribosomal protein L11 methyltransferase
MPASEPVAGSTILARLLLDEPTAGNLHAVLAEVLDPDQATMALVEESSGNWAVEICFSRRPDEIALRGLIAQVAGADAASALAFSTIATRDWVKASLAGLKPVTAGRFAVHGRHDRARIASNRIAIEIEAALAFGTGHHATTRGCLLALDALVKARKERALRPTGLDRRTIRDAGHHVLDLGTGSGVLAIAAAKALRRPVLAGDIDRTAVAAARANARTNGVASLVAVVHATGLTAPAVRARAPYRLVLANILLAPLKQLARPLARALAPGAHVVLSGLLASQANAALSAYRPHGLVLARRITLDGWVTLVMRRP